MDEPALKRKLKQVIGEMQDVLSAPNIDEKAHGNLVGLANEMDRISDDLSDSNVKSAVTSIVYMLGGGIAGYTVGAVIDSLNYLVTLI